ncbi:MAG: hypothetical protein DCC71_17945, partial [Proteobacteria bacterium]
APAARAAGDASAALRIDAPPAQSSVSLPLVEVRGQAAARPLAAHDLVLVLDVSESSLLPSGWDVDGDGARGGTDPDWLAQLAARPEVPPDLIARLREQDFDDSVLAAELAASRALLARLEPGARYRVGIVVFSDTARVAAPLGASREALADALAAVRDGFHRDLRGTNFGDAIGAAQLLLQPETPGQPSGPPSGRDQSILLLSDGTPTLPPHGDRARQHALYAASAAAAADVRVFTFELSRDAATRGVLGEIAQRSGGRFERLERPGDAIARLRRTDLAGLEELRIVNATTGAPARAVRTFPDGSFDALVELAPGANRIRVEVRTTTGGRAAGERVVVRSAPAGAPDGARALLEELRRRTQETALWAEMERERRAPKGELEIRVEPPSGAAPAE